MNGYEIEQAVGALSAEFKDKQAKIRKDRDLSPTGRDKALKALEAERVAAMKAFIKPLRDAAVDTALKIRTLDMADKALDTIQASSWDYGRLQYNAIAVKSAMSLAGDDPWKVQEAFSQARATGDEHLIKSWLDTAPSLFPQTSIHASTWDEVRQDMQASKGLVKSEERQRYGNERRVRMDELSEVSKATTLLADEIGAGSYKSKSVKDRIFSGISVEHDTGVLHVEFGDTLNEDRIKTAARLEAEQAERDAAQGAVFKAFGIEDADPILEGAPDVGDLEAT
jgi:hypothetical protein